MNQQVYIDILKEELIPAMGCTEPIGIAYCSAVARETLNTLPTKVIVKASSNIIKNVKSVIVPHTGKMQGIPVAVAAGIVAGNPKGELEVLSSIKEEDIPSIQSFLKEVPIEVEVSTSPYILDIEVYVEHNTESALVHIAGYHTNIIQIQKNNEVIFEKEYVEKENIYKTDRTLLNVKDIIDFSETVNLELVKDLLEKQIELNMAISKEGLLNDWGANIGKILIKSYGESVNNKAKAFAAAGSDARMSGCEKPVMINSGSGNQGMTCSIPVIVYGNELGASKEKLYRALLISNLITIHLKTGIGRLSAYCGATSAGCGAGAGITYLYGGKYHEIAHTIVNALAINSGMICDGAKPSCAAKIASAVEAGLLGMQMTMNHSEFYDGEGIVIKGVENTINNIGKLAKEGMKETDKEIIKLMIDSI